MSIDSPTEGKMAVLTSAAEDSAVVMFSITRGIKAKVDLQLKEDTDTMPLLLSLLHYTSRAGVRPVQAQVFPWAAGVCLFTCSSFVTGRSLAAIGKVGKLCC